MTSCYVAYAEELPGWYSVTDQENTSRVKRELVDLHNGEFCVDVSEWGEVEYEPVEREKCTSTFEKVCEMKNERVKLFIKSFAQYVLLNVVVGLKG